MGKSSAARATAAPGAANAAGATGADGASRAAARLSPTLRDLRRDLSQARALLEDAVAKARLAEGEWTAPRQTLAQESAAALDRWEERLDGDGPFSYLTCRNEILALSRRRAYLLPAVEIPAEARVLLGELRGWSVPSSVLLPLENVTRDEIAAACQEGGEARARAALNKLYEEYDYWDWYSDWYVARISTAAAFVSLTAILALCGAIYLFLRGQPIWAFLLAGLSGCGVSIVTRLPPLSVYGEASSLFTRIIGRTAAGIVGTAAGLGILASGALKVELGDVAIAELLRGCADKVCQPPGGAGCCPPSALLVLCTLGVLFGFSERALSSFEQTVFGKGEAPARAAEPTPVSPPAQGG